MASSGTISSSIWIFFKNWCNGEKQIYLSFGVLERVLGYIAGYFINILDRTKWPNYFSHFFSFFLASPVVNPFPFFICCLPSPTLFIRRIRSNNWMVSKLSGIFFMAESTCFFVKIRLLFNSSCYTTNLMLLFEERLLFIGRIGVDNQFIFMNKSRSSFSSGGIAWRRLPAR